jgi:hypothetical protein
MVMLEEGVSVRSGADDAEAIGNKMKEYVIPSYIPSIGTEKRFKITLYVGLWVLFKVDVDEKIPCT